MRFDELNPAVVFVYYAAVTVITMFSMNPVIIGIALVSSILCYCLYAKGGIRVHLFSLVLFLVLAVINPLVVHNGMTVLFYLNSRPITLEATLYGVSAAATVTATLYRLRSLSHDFTGDKLLYLCSRLSPKIALILSMALRYVSLFKHRWHKVQDSQKALGLYRDGNLIDAVHGRLRVLSILLTWLLENGVVTALSMDARGYGSRRRTSFAIFRFGIVDLLFILLTLVLTGGCVAAVVDSHIAYYPQIQANLFSAPSIAGYLAYAILGILPVIINTKEAIRWRRLTSAI